MLTELFHALKKSVGYMHHDAENTHALETSSTVIPLILATACATWEIVTGSFRPLTINPFSHFSFLTAFGRLGAVVLCSAEA